MKYTNFENIDDFSEENKDLEEFETFEDISSNSYESDEMEDISSSSTPKKPRRNKKRIIINVVTSVVLAICVLLTTIMGWFVNNADTSLKDVPILKLLFGGANYEDIGYEDENKLEEGDFEELIGSNNEDMTYFLVVGCDWTTSKQTDVIVVVCMDHKNKKVSMLQIPRDTYVEGGYSIDGKINSVYMNAREGELKINALRRCISNQLGIPIDNYVLFSIEGAVNVVEAIGGVSMNLPNAIKIEDPLHFGKYYTIGPGKVKLSGKDAIGFMRKRSGTADEDVNYAGGSDMGRVKQQRKFYAALFKELQGMSTTEIWKIANSCFNQVQTNLTLNEAAAYALAVKKLDMEDINIFGLPGQSCDYNGLSYYSIHKDEYVEKYNKYLNPKEEPVTEADILCPEIYSLVGNTKYENQMSDGGSNLGDY